MNYCAAIKMSELLLRATLREINQTHKKEYILYDSISVYFKTRQDYSAVLLKKEKGAMIVRGREEAFEVLVKSISHPGWWWHGCVHFTGIH